MAIRESFLREIWGRGILWYGKSKQSAKVFSVKIVLFTDSRKFSSSKVSCYTVADNSQMRLGACVHIQN